MAYDAEDAGAKRKDKLRYTDDDFLSIVKAERENAIGIDHTDDVVGDRIRALEYFKGAMKDLPVMPNRSRAVSTDIADAVYTALPDLVEIFLGGEDIGVFTAEGDEDEEAAKQETDAVNFVIMNQNQAFLLVHSAIHDALLQKVGVVHFWREEDETYEEERFEGQTALQLQAAMSLHGNAVTDVVQVGEDPMFGPILEFRIAKTKRDVCIKTEAVDPNRFAVARDTKDIAQTTYCVMLSTPRAQELIEQGFDRDLVDNLPSYSATAQEERELARDTAGENDRPEGDTGATRDLRTVAIHVHNIRLDADGDGKTEVWRVVTNEEDTVLLDKERVPGIQFAAGSPYVTPHRFYGRSVADLLLEVQRIKTALTRMMLDQGYFSINHRHEINMNNANEFTLADYLNNAPGYPVRSAGNALAPLSTSRSDFSPLDSLEYFNTVAEQRTGIVRNAQGLNPDTLHDTAKGAQQLMTAAQKRLRMIARTLAETLFKGLFLGVHTLLRTGGSQALDVRLRGKWVPVDPSSWGARKDMTIEIGMGAGGRDMDLAFGTALGGLMERIIGAQGGMKGPIVRVQNVYDYATWFAERGGLKKGSKFFTDPEANPMPPEEPAPDPQIIKAQMEAQARKEENAQKAQQLERQFEKDMALSQQQQADDMARAEIQDADKKRQHALALLEAQEKARQAVVSEDLQRQKLEDDHEARMAELALRDRELSLKERELDVREKEIEQRGLVEVARLQDAVVARQEAAAERKKERSAAKRAANGRAPEG